MPRRQWVLDYNLLILLLVLGPYSRIKRWLLASKNKGRISYVFQRRNCEGMGSEERR